MATYDKSKLIRMLEQRHRTRIAVRDLFDRYRDATSEASRLRSVIHAQANLRAMRSGEIDRLLSMPTAEAIAIGTEKIQGYDHTIRNVSAIRNTDVNADDYRLYIELRDRAQRLNDEYKAASAELSDRFGLVQHLVSFVKAHGFADPEREV